MTDQTSLEVVLAGARIDPAVTTLRPDYRAPPHGSRRHRPGPG